MHIESLSGGLYRIVQDSGTYLGFRIGRKAARSASRITGLLSTAGTLVEPRGNGTSPWPLEGLVADQDELIVYGPWLDSMQSLSVVDALPRREAMDILEHLGSSVQSSGAISWLPPGGLFLEGLAVDADGRILVLPSGLQKAALSLLPAAARLPVHDCFHRTGWQGIPDFLFGLDVLTFRVMTGSYPYPDVADSNLVAAWQLAGVLKTPRCLAETAPEQVEGYYRERFQERRPHSGDPAGSIRIHRSWIAATPDAGVGHGADPRALQAFLRRQDSFNRRQFLKMNSLKLGAVAAGLAVMAIVLSVVLGNLLRPPRTLGMDPGQVVASYYGCLNSLDLQLMKDAVRSDTAQDMVALTENLYVVSQIRSGTEKRNIRMTLAQWRDAGEPALDPTLMLFGISGLKISEREPAATGQDTHRYLVDYEICSAVPAQKPGNQDGPSNLVATIIRRQDEVSVGPGGKQGAWVIDGLVHHDLETRSQEIPAAPIQTGL